MIFLGKHEVDIRITEDLEEEDARSTDSTASSSASQAETVVLHTEGWVLLKELGQQWRI